MSPRRGPGPRDATRLLVLDPRRSLVQSRGIRDLPELLAPGDLLVLNDAATLPASLRARAPGGHPVELRLLRGGPTGWRALLLGAGDWRIPTEDRPPPPRVAPGDVLEVPGTPPLLRVARVDPRSPRLVALAPTADPTALPDLLLARGRPIQYAYLARGYPAARFQTAYAARPWASEMPSAGRPLSRATLAALRRRGVRLATLTHAAGLSSTGDPALDAALPLPEPYDLPPRTASLVRATRRYGGRVVAVGTTVVRALEGNLRDHGALTPGPGETDLVLTASHRPRVVDGLLSGVHGPSESHYRLLSAFAPRALLERGLAQAAAEGYHNHEFGDSMLVLPDAGGSEGPARWYASYGGTPHGRPLDR